MTNMAATFLDTLKHPCDHHSTIICSVLIGILLIVSYVWVGLFDRAKWKNVVFIQPSRRRLWCIVAMTNDQPHSPTEADELYDSTKKVLDGLATHSKSSSPSPGSPRNNKLWKTSLLLSRAAYHYYGGDSTPTGSISCAVYFEEQGRKATPRSVSGDNKYRCGLGWLVGLENDSEAKSLLSDLAASQSLSTSSQTKSEKYNCPYPIRIVDLGTGPARKVRIPWRNPYTPRIARLLHWNSEFSNCCGGNVDVVECELTIRPGSTYQSKSGTHPGPPDHNPNTPQTPAYVDYLLLNSKTTYIWNPNDFIHQQPNDQTNTCNSKNKNSSSNNHKKKKNIHFASNHNIFSELLAAVMMKNNRSKRQNV